jgi:GT2 family glycosyltransferase
MKLGFVFTNYNNSQYSQAAVASIVEADKCDDVQIVVVDNGSTATDVALLEQTARELPCVDLILNADNMGYFRGLNVGISHLRKHLPPPGCIVVGNNDLIFPRDFVATVQQHADVFRSQAVVAPDLVTPDGVHQNPHVAFPISRFRKIVWDIYFLSYGAAVVIKHLAKLTKGISVRKENAPASELYRTPGPIEQGYGACYLLGPLFFQHFGRLCAPTLIMQEEFFLSEQLNSIGQTVYYDPRFVVYHRDHATTDTLPSKRHWELSQSAHLVYKRYLRLSKEERLTFILSESR